MGVRAKPLTFHFYQETDFISLLILSIAFYIRNPIARQEIIVFNKEYKIQKNEMRFQDEGVAGVHFNKFFFL